MNDVKEPQLREYNQKIAAGCGVLLLVGLLVLAGFIVSALQQEQRTTHYPGATHISSNNNYQRLPHRLSRVDFYHTEDPFTQVYNWYSTGFDLGPEARANGRCIDLEGSQSRFLNEQRLSVTLCNTPTGQIIHVTRYNSLRLLIDEP
ncbi:MAG: hypothetical protein R6X32_22375 [Chloroflexota bacterium]